VRFVVSIVTNTDRTAAALDAFDAAARELRTALEREVPAGSVLNPWLRSTLALADLQVEDMRRALAELGSFHITAAEQAVIDQDDRAGRTRYAANPSHSVTKEDLDKIHNDAFRRGMVLEAKSEAGRAMRRDSASPVWWRKRRTRVGRAAA
jgi:hypothetical protein